jgi:hypothetical protein
MLYIITHSYSIISRVKSNDALKSQTCVQDISQPQINDKDHEIKNSFVKISTSTNDEEMFAKDLIKPRKDSETILSMKSIAQRLKLLKVMIKTKSFSFLTSTVHSFSMYLLLLSYYEV